MTTAELPALVTRLLAFVFGTLWGSFFNVCIYRWPREMSVVTPPSHCPGCGAPISPAKNVPVFGYLLLRGRAACCGTKLSPRYLMVEVLAGFLCLACFERYFVAGDPRDALPALAESLLYFAFTGGLLVATFVDLEWMEIPDEVSLPGAALGLASLALRPGMPPIDAAVGAGVGFLGVQLLFVWGYEAVFGRRGMGEGDSKFLLFIGAFLGWQGVLFALVAGALQGLVAAVVLLATGRNTAPVRPDALAPKEGAAADAAEAPPTTDAAAADPDDEDEFADGRLRIPFGPFLALAALEYLFFGDRVVEAYQGLFAI